MSSRTDSRTGGPGTISEDKHRRVPLSSRTDSRTGGRHPRDYLRGQTQEIESPCPPEQTAGQERPSQLGDNPKIVPSSQEDRQQDRREARDISGDNPKIVPSSQEDRQQDRREARDISGDNPRIVPSSQEDRQCTGGRLGGQSQDSS